MTVLMHISPPVPLICIQQGFIGIWTCCLWSYRSKPLHHSRAPPTLDKSWPAKVHRAHFDHSTGLCGLCIFLICVASCGKVVTAVNALYFFVFYFWILFGTHNQSTILFVHPFHTGNILWAVPRCLRGVCYLLFLDLNDWVRWRWWPHSNSHLIQADDAPLVALQILL